MHEEHTNISGKRKGRKMQSALERKWRQRGGHGAAAGLPSASEAASTLAGYQASQVRCPRAQQMPRPLQRCRTRVATQALFDPVVGRLGSRRFRRWANERLLRELSGPLTASDMEQVRRRPRPSEPRDRPLTPLSLFPTALQAGALWGHLGCPFALPRDLEARARPRVGPFQEHQHGSREQGPGEVGGARPRSPGCQAGQARAGPFSGLVAAEHARALGFKRQGLSCHCRGVALSPAAMALACWASISKKARQALRRAPLELVEELELRMLGMLPAPGGGSSSGSEDEGGGAEEEPVVAVVSESEDAVVFALVDGFQRLLVHGLAEFHDLRSRSYTDEATGARHTSVRYRGSAEAGPSGRSQEVGAAAAAC